MEVSELRKATFKAAWEIQRMMWGEGMFVRDLIEGDHIHRNRRVLKDGLQCSDTMPSSGRYWVEPELFTTYGNSRGRIFTVEGLVVNWNENAEPEYMWTPWGEWFCWASVVPRRVRNPFSLKEKERFMKAVDLYPDPSKHERERPLLHVRSNYIRRVGTIELPMPETIGTFSLPRDPRWKDAAQDEFRRRSSEWIQLCEDMEPKRYPIWKKYVEADIPLPQNHPDRKHALWHFDSMRRFAGYPEKAYVDQHYPRSASV